MLHPFRINQFQKSISLCETQEKKWQHVQDIELLRSNLRYTKYLFHTTTFHVFPRSSIKSATCI